MICLQSQKQVFQIPLKKVFVNAVMSVGFGQPFFSVTRYPGCFQVTIDLNAGTRQINIAGDRCQSVELAEVTAINKALAHLRRRENVSVVDITAKKKKKLVITARQLYQELLSGISVVDWMIMKWKKCVANLGVVEEYARTKIKDANVVDAKFADPLDCHLLVIKGGASIYITDLETKLKLVRDKRKSASLGSSKDLIVLEVSILSFVLSSMKPLYCTLSCENEFEMNFVSS